MPNYWLCLYFFRLMQKCCKCIRDVICKIPVFGGANSVLLDEPFPYIHRLVLKLCKKATKVFTTDANMWQKVQALIRHSQIAQHMIRACSLCPSINRVFPDDITYEFHISQQHYCTTLSICIGKIKLWKIRGTQKSQTVPSISREQKHFEILRYG